MQKAYIDRMKDEWEQTRFLAFTIVKTVDSKNKIKKPSDLLPFEWDAKPKEFAPMTPEEKAEQIAFDARADEILKTTNPEAYAAYMAGKNKTDG